MPNVNEKHRWPRQDGSFVKRVARMRMTLRPVGMNQPRCATVPWSTCLWAGCCDFRDQRPQLASCCRPPWTRTTERWSTGRGPPAAPSRPAGVITGERLTHDNRCLSWVGITCRGSLRAGPPCDEALAQVALVVWPPSQCFGTRNMPRIQNTERQAATAPATSPVARAVVSAPTRICPKMPMAPAALR